MHFKENFHWINEGEVVIEENRIIMTREFDTYFNKKYPLG